MTGRWRTRDGCYSVEAVTLTATPNHHDGTRLRVRHFGYWVADVASVDELAQLVPVEALEEQPPATGSVRCLSEAQHPSLRSAFPNGPS